MKTDEVEIHVPSIVERELETHLVSMLPKLTGEHRRAMKWLPPVEREAATTVFRRLRDNARQFIEQGVDEWLASLEATREAPSDVNVDRIFAGYFSGSPPFHSAKARQDLPDAFIFAAIREFVEGNGGSVHVLVRDGKLSDSCRDLPGVSVHSDLAMVLRIPELAPSLPTAEITTFVRGAADELTSRLAVAGGEAVLDLEVKSDEFPSDSNDASVTGFGEAKDIEVDFDEIEVVGTGNAVVVNLTFAVESNLVDLFIFKPDWYGLADDAPFSLADFDWNDHYVRAQAYVDLDVNGAATVEILKDARGRYTLGEVEIAVDTAEVTHLHGSDRAET